MTNVFRRFRRFAVAQLELDLCDELKWAREFAANSPKNYQVWHYRASLLQSIGNSSGELDQMIGDFLLEPKNYHAWQYRQWILQTYGGPFEDEIRLVDELLRLDVYNNSAWNHRHFVFMTMCPTDAAWKAAELAFTQARLKSDPTNEAALAYLKWLNKL